MAFQVRPRAIYIITSSEFEKLLPMCFPWLQDFKSVKTLVHQELFGAVKHTIEEFNAADYMLCNLHANSIGSGQYYPLASIDASGDVLQYDEYEDDYKVAWLTFADVFCIKHHVAPKNLGITNSDHYDFSHHNRLEYLFNHFVNAGLIPAGRYMIEFYW